MTATRTLHRSQTGSFLLEALIGILIFTFGILGLVGLQAQSMRVTNDTEFRAEAAYLASRLVSEMWTADQTSLKATYGSTAAGGGYTAFQGWITTAGLPGVTALANAPTVLFNDEITPAIPAPSQQGNVVQITVFWLLPGEQAPHQYETTAVIGRNCPVLPCA
jgi:type IV pilus assembly protein PilV